MKIAIIGSRNLQIEIDNYIPKNATEIITGGARGIDTLAYRYAKKNNIPCRIYPPMYEFYGRAAPIVRNKQIVEQSDLVLAFWDGVSSGTKFTINYAKKINKKVEVYLFKQ